MKTQKKTEFVKTSVTLPRDMLETLQRLSKRSGSSMTDIVRRAIQTRRLIDETRRQGGKLLVKQRDNSVREVVFRHK